MPEDAGRALHPVVGRLKLAPAAELRLRPHHLPPVDHEALGGVGPASFNLSP